MRTGGTRRAKERLRTAQGVRVSTGPENRPIFLGMNVGVPELRSSDVKGKNPFAEVRVRQAINTAINREAIRDRIMGGSALPTANIVPPGFFGHSEALRPDPFDAERARQLLQSKVVSSELLVGLRQVIVRDPEVGIHDERPPRVADSLVEVAGMEFGHGGQRMIHHVSRLELARAAHLTQGFVVLRGV